MQRDIVFTPVDTSAPFHCFGHDIHMGFLSQKLTFVFNYWKESNNYKNREVKNSYTDFWIYFPARWLWNSCKDLTKQLSKPRSSETMFLSGYCAFSGGSPFLRPGRQNSTREGCYYLVGTVQAPYTWSFLILTKTQRIVLSILRKSKGTFKKSKQSVTELGFNPDLLTSGAQM